jgi:hypothetical protein
MNVDKNQLMDASSVIPVAIVALAVTRAQQKENYNLKAAVEDVQQNPRNTIRSLISLAIFLFAAYLSWSCNSRCAPGMGVIEKVFRAFFAGVFGIVYLIIYFIFFKVDCGRCVLPKPTV